MQESKTNKCFLNGISENEKTLSFQREVVGANHEAKSGC